MAKAKRAKKAANKGTRKRAKKGARKSSKKGHGAMGVRVARLERTVHHHSTQIRSLGSAVRHIYAETSISKPRALSRLPR